MSNSDVILSQIRQRLEILYQMVDELEAGGGGGGGGGTTNYNNLTNKPAIEGQQLVGNKTASDLGLATTSELNGKVDKVAGSSLMTSAQATKLEGIEAGAEVNVQADWNQANSSSDDYIKNKPTLGAAAEKGVDTVPTEDSTNLITSGAVYDAVQGGGGGGGTVTPTYFGTSIPNTLTDAQYAVIQNRLPISTGTTEATATNIFSFLGEDNSAYWYGYTTGYSANREIYQTICRIAKNGKTTYTWPQASVYTDSIAASKISSANAAVQIPSNQNLDIKSAGYSFATSAVAATLTNCPTTEAFKLFTDDVAYGGTSLIQRLYTCSATPAVYIRAKVNGTWGSWYKFEGTVVS